MTPPPQDIDRMTRALGWRPTSFRLAAANRQSSATAARWVVGDGGRSAFVKVGATALTADWIRREHLNYQTIAGWFMPQMLGFDDDGERPVLGIEDLSTASWPPPWSTPWVAAVHDVFAAIHATAIPTHLATAADRWEGSADWQTIELDPGPFLALELCSRDWLADALPTLRAAAETAPIAGDALIHGDMRSDNMCFRAGQAIVIDWNHAQVANPEFDVA